MMLLPAIPSLLPGTAHAALPHTLRTALRTATAMHAGRVKHRVRLPVHLPEALRLCEQLAHMLPQVQHLSVQGGVLGVQVTWWGSEGLVRVGGWGEGADRVER